jgi:hypothetical protein
MMDAEENKLLISDFLDVEQSTFCADISVIEIFDAINNGSPDSESYTSII